MKIGVISDTHGLLRPEALAQLTGADHIIHAGDIGSPDIIPRLTEMAPVTAVRGNVDTQPWARAFPAWDVLTLAGRMIYVIHDVAALNLDLAAAGIGVLVYGHSHKPNTETVNDVVHLNPGSAGPRRFKFPVTLATVDLSATPLQPLLHTLVA